MVIVFSILIALLIVTGQALWKAAVTGITDNHMQLMSSAGFLYLVKSPKLYFGVLVYGLATLGYITLLSKYKYFQVQSIVVGGSLIFTLVIAHLLFHEQASVVNAIGIALVLAGAVLIVR